MSNDLATTPTFVWINPGAGSDKPTLVRLASDTLTLAVIPPADLEHAIEALKEGGDVVGHVIPLSSLVGAKGEQDGAALTITFRVGPSKEESRPLAFADRGKRDEFAAALADALGPGWQHGRRPMSRWKAGFWTLAPTAVVALATWGLHAEAARIAAGNPAINWGKNGKLELLAIVAHWVERQLGPTGVLIAGGALVAAGLLIFALVMASPPINIVVERANQS